LSAWTLDYLTDRPQYVRTRDCEFDIIVCNTGSPQGTVLAPFLFTIYTADFMFSSATCHLQKFSDDSAIVGLIMNDDDREYRELIQNFVDWCQWSCLQINAGKTKELVVDFRRHKQTLLPVNIQGRDIVRVDSYKYNCVQNYSTPTEIDCFGRVHITQDLSWNCHTNTLVKKARQRLYHLRRLRDFKLPSQVLKTFYTCTIESFLIGSITSWFRNSTMQDRQALQRVVCSAKHTIHTELPNLQDI
ncbi:gastrula zinc finger protein XlCGF28.1-like, partial [Silurus asotus]